MINTGSSSSSSSGSSSSSSSSSSNSRRRRRRNYEERLNPKWRRQLQKPGSNWPELPRDIFECIIGRLHWMDRIQILAVCKAWSVPNRHIPTIDDEVKVPWAMTFIWNQIDNSETYVRCRLLDPLSREYIAEESIRGKEFQDFRYTVPRASLYGWVLYKVYDPETFTKVSFFLYSPFTTELIKLPDLGNSIDFFDVATFSLNATSPKCVIFLLHVDHSNRKIYVKICSPGDSSWKTFEFNNGFEESDHAVDVVYSHGIFICVFAKGQLGAFFVEHEKWIIVSDHTLGLRYLLRRPALILSDSGLLLFDFVDPKYLKLFKFDFSEMRWRYERSLNNNVLFIGCTSFAAPAVGETSQLANTIFFSGWSRHSSYATCYGSTPPGTLEKEPCGSGSLLYYKCVEAAKCGDVWIELPLGGIWRANDLINAV